MSMSVSESAEVAAVYRALSQGIYTDYAVAGLVFYEHILTIPAEVRLISRRRWTASTFLFMVNRYAMIANVMLGISPYTNKVCHSSAVLQNIISILSYNVVDTVFSTLRVFALSGRSKLIAALVLGLGIVPICINLYLSTQESPSYSNDPIFGSICSVSLSLSPSIAWHFTLIGNVFGITGDALVVLVTWSQTFKNAQEAARLKIRSKLSETLLRDGSLFLLTALFIDIYNVLAYAVPGLQDTQYLAAIVEMLPQILLSRFLINLREAAEPYASGDTAVEHFSRFSAPEFHVPTSTIDRFIGNIGEPLEFRNQDDEDIADHLHEEQVESVVDTEA